MDTKTKQETAPPAKGTEIQRAAPLGLFSPFEEMERMFGSLVPRSWLRPLWSEFPQQLELKMPRVDVIERDEDIVVRAEMPGVDKKDVDVSVNDSSITLRGKTHREEKEERGDYYRCEISRGSLSRTVPLPAGVDAENVRAVLKDGVLEVTLRKADGAKRRNVKVQ